MDPREKVLHSTIITIFLVVTLWIAFKNLYVEGMENAVSEDVDVHLYDDITDGLPYQNTTFVSGLTDYHPPFMRVVDDGTNIYIPMHNSRRSYEEQMHKFR